MVKCPPHLNRVASSLHCAVDHGVSLIIIVTHMFQVVSFLWH